MTKIYKFNIRGKILYMIERETSGYYYLNDTYVPIAGNVIIENFTQKEEFFLYEVIEAPIHKPVQDILMAANDMLPNGTDDIDIVYKDFLGRWGPSINNIILTIKWGDVEITNSNEQRHPLLGICTRISINHYLSNGSMKMNNFYIFRERLSAFEKFYNYKHSHVQQSASIIGFNQVCLGESDLKLLFMKRRLSSKNFDFYRLFMYIESFIKWESLEGGPYFKLTNLYENIGIEQNSDQLSIEDIINMIEEMDIEILLNSYNVRIPSNIIEEVMINNSNIKKCLPNSSLIKKDNWWESYNTSEVYDTGMMFREDDLKVTIIPNTEEDDILAETVFCAPNKKVSKYLSKKFSEILTDNPWVEIIEEEDESQHVELPEVISNAVPMDHVSSEELENLLF